MASGQGVQVFAQPFPHIAGKLFMHGRTGGAALLSFALKRPLLLARCFWREGLLPDGRDNVAETTCRGGQRAKPDRQSMPETPR